MEENEKVERTLWQSFTRIIFYSVIGIICLGLLIIMISSSSSKPLYSPNYELKILRESNPISYKCDSFSINGNEYHLFDTNKVETNLIIIPNNLIVDIKTLDK